MQLFQGFQMFFPSQNASMLMSVVNVDEIKPLNECDAAFKQCVNVITNGTQYQ